jgi:hypothetical protein
VSRPRSARARPRFGTAPARSQIPIAADSSAGSRLARPAEELMVRLPEAEIAGVKKQGGRDFEPMAGHKMGGYVIVPGDWRTKPAPAVALIKKALAHARAMPAKTANKAATKKLYRRLPFRSGGFGA